MLAAMGCRCNTAPDPEPAEPVVLPHYAGWDRLVAAAVDGRLADAQGLGEQLTGGEPAEHPDGAEHAAAVGAALGFLRFAEDIDEVAAAVSAAAGACGQCHAAARVPAPRAPEATPEQRAQLALHALLWLGPATDAQIDAATLAITGR